MNGQKLFFVKNCTDISVAEFAKGVYILEIETIKGKTLQKVVLN